MRSSSLVNVVLVVLAVPLLCGGTAAFAQQDRNAQALARAQALLRQVSGEKQELEIANARLLAEKDALEQKLARAEGGLKAANASLAVEQRKAGALESTREQLTQSEARSRATDNSLRAAKAQLREAEARIAEVSGRVAELEGLLADSERKNLQLYRANVELVELYRDKGPLTALLQREPTGLKSVGIENIVQEYRLKLDDSLTDANREALRRGDTPGAPTAD